MTAYDRIVKRAHELQAADKSLDEPAAVVKVIEEDEALYAAYRQECRSGVRQTPPPKPVQKAAPVKTLALQKLEEAAQRIQKGFADEGEWIDEREALVQAAQLHPELYAAYRDERRRAQWRA